MNEIIISLNKNKIKLVTIGKEGLLTLSADVSKEVVEDSRILDKEAFSLILEELITQLTQISKKRLSLIFVSEPDDTILRFITVNKGNGDVEEQILDEIKKKLGEVKLDDLYFSYKKIAPFLYQFIGVKKEHLEAYVDVATSIGVELKGVLSWISLLPKYLNINDPSIFISKIDGEQVVALSELNGIFFTGTYEKDTTKEELEKLVSDLSLYKRSQPIDKVFTLRCDALNLGEYNIEKIEAPKLSEKDTQGYEIPLIVAQVKEDTSSLMSSQLNLLNLLPLPVVVGKPKALVIAGTVTAALVFVGMLIGGFYLLKNNQGINPSNLASTDNPETAVLSENTESNTQEEEVIDLKREDLVVRIENGAGISGLAGKTQEKLENLGYTVDSIDTAEFARSDTLLQFKADKAEYGELLAEDLKEAFPDITVEDSLSEEAEYDVLIIAGTSSNL